MTLDIVTLPAYKVCETGLVVCKAFFQLHCKIMTVQPNEMAHMDSKMQRAVYSQDSGITPPGFSSSQIT